jgi:hypothetical protein
MFTYKNNNLCKKASQHQSLSIRLRLQPSEKMMRRYSEQFIDQLAVAILREKFFN